MNNSKIIAFALSAHQDTNQKYDGHPYALHLAMVVQVANRFMDVIPNSMQETMINACWLHDVIEDCRMTYSDLRRVAGDDVANVVYAVTNEKGKNRTERASDKYYEEMIKVPFARFVKMCDRIANIEYSIETLSRMRLVYAKENETFIAKLFPDKGSRLHYQNMIDHLNCLNNQK